ncbi:hypothetical protein GCM10009820_22740 [Leifsonia soli]
MGGPTRPYWHPNWGRLARSMRDPSDQAGVCPRRHEIELTQHAVRLARATACCVNYAGGRSVRILNVSKGMHMQTPGLVQARLVCWKACPHPIDPAIPAWPPSTSGWSPSSASS